VIVNLAVNSQMDDVIKTQLERRLGRLHARQRLGIEKDHEAQIFGQGINSFHIENWYSIRSLSAPHSNFSDFISVV
jgi:hypothetical protein